MWKHAAGELADSSLKTTSASRAWRRCAVWLGTILRTKKPSVAEAARWKLLHYNHPKPDKARASEEQLAAMDEFTSWKATLQPRQLLEPTWARMLKEVAVKQAEKQETAAQSKALVSWVQYLHEGPASGLRRQHQFTKTATGWTETTIAE